MRLKISDMDLLCCVVMHTLRVNFFKNKRLHSHPLNHFIGFVIRSVCQCECAFPFIKGIILIFEEKIAKNFSFQITPSPLTSFTLS